MSRNQFIALARMHEYVVLDTNVLGLDLNEVAPSNGIDYRNKLAEALVEHQNFATSPQIMAEMSLFLSKNKLYRHFFEHSPLRIVRPEEIGERFDAIYNFILPVAEDEGIIEDNKGYPYADVEVASLAFSLSYPGRRVAFLSSDRRLDEVVAKMSKGHRGLKIPVEAGKVVPYAYDTKLRIFAEHLIGYCPRKFTSITHNGNQGREV